MSHFCHQRLQKSEVGENVRELITSILTMFYKHFLKNWNVPESCLLFVYFLYTAREGFESLTDKQEGLVCPHRDTQLSKIKSPSAEGKKKLNSAIIILFFNEYELSNFGVSLHRDDSDEFQTQQCSMCLSLT